MTALTIGRMAKLYGLHRSTLHEAVSRGRLSVGVDAHGQRVIDLSEMIRVYGESVCSPDTALHPAAATEGTAPTATDGVIQALVEEVRLLRSELAQMRAELMRIEHKPEPIRPEQIAPAQSFADLLREF